MQRIAALEAPYEVHVEAQLASMMPTGVPPIALFRTMARNLDMTTAMHHWGRYELGRDLSLTMRQREIVIDRSCARSGCEYEWGVHVMFFAERVGLTAAQVTSLTHGEPGDPCWNHAEQLLLQAVDEMHDTSDIGDQLWDQLSAAYSDAQLLDLVMLCGWYHAISFTARAARVALEPGAPRFADVRSAPQPLSTHVDQGMPAMFVPDTCCTLVPYFEIEPGELEAFTAIAHQLVARTQTEAGCLHYAFTYNGNVAHCREGYVDANAVLAHRENVAELLGRALTIAKIVRYEVHGPAAEIDKLRGPMASRNPQFFALEAGIRRSNETAPRPS